MTRRKRCKHEAAIHTWREGRVGPIASQCSKVFGCGEWLPLGPSNDDSGAVRVEMRAAELEVWIAIDGLHVGDEFSTLEIAGWTAWVAGGDLTDDIRAIAEPGWLAAEAYTAESGYERPEAWPWDISRPLAGQFEEWERAAEIEASTPLRHLDGWTGPDEVDDQGNPITAFAYSPGMDYDEDDA